MNVTFDLSKTSDFEIANLIAKRDVLQYAIETIDQILNKIGEAKGLTDSTNPPHQPTNQPNQNVTKPTNTEPNFDHLPWKSYATKQNADPNESAWIFANTKGAETLLTTLKNNNDKTTIGTFKYSLQGTDPQFIARNPNK